MHVCYLINQLAPGGAPTLILDIIKNTDDDVTYTVCYIEGDDSLVSNLENAGAEVVDFGATFKFDPRALYRMANFFRNRKFDVLHTHLPYAQTLGRLASRIGDVDAVVSTQHNVPENYHPVTRTLERATRGIDDATVAVSEGVERAFRNNSHRFDGSLDDGWCTIYNGLNVEEYNKAVKEADPKAISADIDPDTVVYLNIARYVPAKAQTDLIDAMNILTESEPNAHLFVVGWGEEENAIRERVSEHGLEDSVTVTGRVPSVYEYYGFADVFVSSSIFEGLPITHLEAMAAELPLVTTEIPGVKEMVVDEKTGYLVPPESPENLADAMKQLAEKDTREKMAAAGFNRVSELFSIEDIVEYHLQLYRLAIES
ncbi:glycosyltransferase [Natrinema saccharevitans]|uniref:Glycosyltransferase n=1 Tax=Natrinema saccharevitans TaxID=301967 RepID=A0A1S8AVY1_9EURY|nr:glycosyltransferase [Natrinema saccharevitans]OLZ40766.1 glycosyltransferase [Natrinema saccharevitans]